MEIAKLDPGGRLLPTSPVDTDRVTVSKDALTDVFGQATWEALRSGQIVPGLIVTNNYFEVFKVRHAPSAADNLPQVLLSSRAAFSSFGLHSPLGKMVEPDGCPFRIAAVAPPSFSGADTAPPDFWVGQTAAASCAAASAIPQMKRSSLASPRAPWGGGRHRAHRTAYSTGNPSHPVNPSQARKNINTGDGQT